MDHYVDIITRYLSEMKQNTFKNTGVDQHREPKTLLSVTLFSIFDSFFLYPFLSLVFLTPIFVLLRYYLVDLLVYLKIVNVGIKKRRNKFFILHHLILHGRTSRKSFLSSVYSPS